VATLASTPEAHKAIEELRLAWAERRVEPEAAQAVIDRLAHDESVHLARVYLAFALLERGELAKADAVLETLLGLKPGATADLVTVARARSFRLHSAPIAALEVLRGLVGKVVDETDRDVFLEELSLSAIAAHADYEALAYLDAWLRSAPEADRARVKAKILQLVEPLSRDVLEQTYRAMRERGSEAGYGVETRRLVAARLVRIAVETDDAPLARWLLERGRVQASDLAELEPVLAAELRELAMSRRGIVTVSGKTVGLLLPTRTRQLRDEAADVLRGVSFALGLPRRAGALQGVRLVTRDEGLDAVSTRASLDELAGEGAAIIIAGFDRDTADWASAWSEKAKVPVLLLAAPSAAQMPKRYGFVLGERTEREIGMLADALLRRGVTTAALVADAEEDVAAARVVESTSLVLLPPVRCDVPLAVAGKPRFPVDAWASAGAHGWLVSGPASCARDLVRDIARLPGSRAQGATKVLVLSLEAGVSLPELPRGLVVMGSAAGLIPVIAAPSASDARQASVAAFIEAFGVRPSYWTALGRDAGALAAAALAPLPDNATSEPRGVTQRRAIAQAGLFGARLDFWTSDERGLGKDRVLARSLHLVTWPGL